MSNLDINKLMDLVPASIFNIDDFKDAKVEWDMPELKYDEYKPLRAAEYVETHKLDTTDAEVDALVDQELEAIEDAVEETTEKLFVETEEPTTIEEHTEKVVEELKTAPKPKATSPKKRAKRAAPNADSKKAQTIVIYTEITKAGGSRKDGIARLTSELGMSKAAASTYWQNVKSGKWA